MSGSNLPAWRTMPAAADVRSAYSFLQGRSDARRAAQAGSGSSAAPVTVEVREQRDWLQRELANKECWADIRENGTGFPRAALKVLDRVCSAMYGHTVKAHLSGAPTGVPSGKTCEEAAPNTTSTHAPLQATSGPTTRSADAKAAEVISKVPSGGLKRGRSDNEAAAAAAPQGDNSIASGGGRAARIRLASACPTRTTAAAAAAAGDNQPERAADPGAAAAAAAADNIEPHDNAATSASAATKTEGAAKAAGDKKTGRAADAAAAAGAAVDRRLFASEEPAAAAATGAPSTSTLLPPGPRSCLAKRRKETEEDKPEGEKEAKKTVKWLNPVHDGGNVPASAAAAPAPSFWPQALWRMVMKEEEGAPADVIRMASYLVSQLEAGLRGAVVHPTLAQYAAMWCFLGRCAAAAAIAGRSPNAAAAAGAAVDHRSEEPAAAAAAAAPTTSTALPPGPRSCMAKPRQESEEEDEESKKTVKWSDPVHDGGYMPAVAAAAPEPSFWQQAAWRMVVAEEQKEPADVMRAASLMVPELEAGLRSLVPHPTLAKYAAMWRFLGRCAANGGA